MFKPRKQLNKPSFAIKNGEVIPINVGQSRVVDMSDHPRLFKIFMVLNTKKAVKDFLGKYGPLCLHPYDFDNSVYPEATTEEILLEAEWMREAWQLWQALALSPPDLFFLRDRIKPDQSTQNIYYETETVNWTSQWIGEAFNPNLPEDPRELHITQQGAVILSEIVNSRLHNNDKGYAVKPQVSWSGKNKTLAFKLEFEPDPLITILWLQLAQEVSGAGRFTGCKVCGTPVYIAARKSGGHKNDTIYCSAKCKVKAFRNKRSLGKKKRVRVQ